jgi:hypothetical protein
MATAALFKPTQALQDALKAYVVKIDSETISDIPLKATLVFEALQKYNVSPTVLGEILGKSTETIEAYISQRIDPTMRVQFGGTNYLEIDRAKVERQIKSVKTFANLTFQGGMSDEWYTNDMAKKLARVGITDIMDFAEHIDQNNFEIPAGSIVQKDYSKDEISYFWPETNGEEFIKAHFVDSNNVIEINDGIDIYYRLLNRDIGSRPTNYYYNKKNGQKFPLENGTEWESAFEGKGGVYYNVKFSETGIPIFYTQWIDTSDLTGLMPLISIGAMAFTFGGGAAWLGGNILGSVGLTASPTITAAVGTVAFNTAVTGGDIENAVKKTASSLIGNEFGGAIGASADSVAIGKAASIATTATLQGKQIDPASIAFAMFQSDKTGKNMDDFTFDPGNDWTGGFDDYLIDQSLIDITLADLDISTDPLLLSIALEENEIILSENGIDVSEISADGEGTLYTQDGSFVGMSSDQYVDSIYVDENGHVRGPDNEIIIEKNEAANLSDQQMSDKILADMETKSGQVTRSIAAPASRPASIPPAANETKQPTISDSFATYDKILKSVVSIGASVKAISNGTFRPTYATSPYGTPRVQAVGVPIRQPNGSTITNNGNGTQTIRYVDGTTQTTSSTYTGLTGSNLFGGINTTTLAIGGGVLLVAFLLARRK